MLTILPIENEHVEEVIALWQRCGSTRAWNDPAGDIAVGAPYDQKRVTFAKWLDGRQPTA